ncbi:MAG: hypothetical protein KKH88_00655 [Nanoarchaeota archaeon]|nr:hypothetical protein [Nanoarchaeota archaeon]
MEIKTEQDMNNFCEVVTKRAEGVPFEVNSYSSLTLNQELDWDRVNGGMIAKEAIGANSHLQKGIKGISWTKEHIGKVSIDETPLIFPSKTILEGRRDLIGPMTGVLVNCYDPLTKNVLFQMRGSSIDAPFGFQAAAAGMGTYGQELGLTAGLELLEEASLENYRQLLRGRAIDILPFMKGGADGVPQPLFSFGFSDDLSRFEACRSLDEIATFEERTKTGLREGILPEREGYHFTVPYDQVETIAGKLNEQGEHGRFYGPIHESTTNFLRALRDYSLV